MIQSGALRQRTRDFKREKSANNNESSYRQQHIAVTLIKVSMGLLRNQNQLHFLRNSTSKTFYFQV